MNPKGIRIRPKVRESEVDIREQYNRLYEQYINGYFTYKSYVLLKKLCATGSKEPNMMGVPLYYIISYITKIMMMNYLYLLFFGSTIIDMKWKVSDSCLKEYLEEEKGFTFKIPKEDNFLRNVQLSLLLIAYIVKVYLNYYMQVKIFDFKVREMTRNNFDKMYQLWVDKFKINFKFNPKNMNAIFKQMDEIKKVEKSKVINYNELVRNFFGNSFANYDLYYEKRRPQEEIKPEINPYPEMGTSWRQDAPLQDPNFSFIKRPSLRNMHNTSNMLSRLDSSRINPFDDNLQ